jgi:5,10-methylene-tetrahydrofolate dehydrogenase/methenyl tetrahydrofolate cyclohydrolase
MIIDGKKIAESIYTGLQLKVADLSRVPRLAVITCAPNFETAEVSRTQRKESATLLVSRQE